MIKFKDVTFYYGSRTLLNKVSFLIQPKQKIGIVGKNGCGKTTLFGLLRGALTVNQGEINSSNGLDFAYLEQELSDTTDTALEYVLKGDQALNEIEAKLTKAESEEDYDAMMKLHMKLADIDGYTAQARAAKLLIGLGFAHEAHHQMVKQFSGGWRMRLNLAKVLFSRSNVMLLDEPTNHLDLDAIIWLEQWLRSYAGTLLIISHDRDFLDNVVDNIIHIHHQKINCFKGNYSSFESMRAEQLLRQQAEYESQQAKISHMMDYVNRFRFKASKAKQAQSRLKAIERLPILETIQNDTDYHFNFFELSKYPNPMVNIENASVGYQEKRVLHRVNIQVGIGQRIGLVGPNGAGKSTLIKMIMGELNLLQGKRFVADINQIGYFAQHQFELLDKHQSALEHMKDLAEQTNEKDLRTYLGGFGFSQELALQPLVKCSGGEKAKLILAMLIWKKPALLLLDEPTNHLDMDMRNALIVALQQFQGSLIVVSHDRYLLRMTTDELWLVANGQVKSFDGDVNDYEKWFLSQ